MSREKNFTLGLLLLTFSAVAAKICGMVFKIPLLHIIGEDGMGYFSSAYVIYNFFFVLTTSGLPVGLSILVSDAQSVKRKRRYLFAAFELFGGAGVFLCIGMTAFSRQLAVLAGNPGAWRCISVMGPTLLFTCLSGVIRGYFQGQKDMLPTALSQIIEAAVKTALGLFLADLAVKSGKGAEESSAYALSGILTGSFLSLFYLIFRLSRDLRKNRILPSKTDEIKEKGIRQKVLSVVLPVSAAAAVMSVSSLIDLATVMHRLQASGFSAEEANRLYGNYSGLVLPLFNLPNVLVSPIAASLIPHLSDALSLGDREKAGKLAKRALSLSVMISAPCFVGYAVLAKPILSLLFEENAAKTAFPLLVLISPSVLLVALSTVGGALLQAYGKRIFPVMAVAAGAVCKICAGYFLVFRYGMIGAPAGTFLCYFISASVDLLYAARKGMIDINFRKTFVFPFTAAVLCGITAKITYSFFEEKSIIGLFWSIFTAAIVYGFVLLVTGCVDKEIIDGLIKKIFGRSVGRKRKNGRESKGAHQGTL